MDQANPMNCTIDPVLMTLIRCPVTQSGLKLAEPGLIDQLNVKIANRQLADRSGQPVDVPFECGLVNQDGSIFLPIRGGIAVLIADQAILTENNIG